ncbi:MAG TPA: permease prefix domain 1-containing protein, partial [Gemmatimonadales bacterium]
RSFHAATEGRAVIRQALVRLGALFRRQSAERDLDDELRYHLDEAVRRHVARGLSETDARAAAIRQFGNLGAVKESVRDSWGLGWLADARQDAGYALRGFVRGPAFALTVVATIAIGLGLNTSFFTLFNTYVLQPLAVRDPYSLYDLSLKSRQSLRNTQFLWSEYQELRHNATFTESFAYQFFVGRVAGAPVSNEAVSGDHFTVLGVGTALGRTIGPDDDVSPGTGPVAVLSHQHWQVRYGADSSIIGHRIVMNGRTLTIVGVMRPDFVGEQSPVDFWVPLSELGLIQDNLAVVGPHSSRG